MLNLAPGYNQYHAFCATIDPKNNKDKPAILAVSNIISNDKGDHNDKLQLPANSS